GIEERKSVQYSRLHQRGPRPRNVWRKYYQFAGRGSTRKNPGDRQEHRREDQRTRGDWVDEVSQRAANGISPGNTGVIFASKSGTKKDQGALRQTPNQLDRAVAQGMRERTHRGTARLWRND